MKKFFALLLLLMLVGCVGNSNESDGRIAPDIVISDRFFVQQMQEIIMNPAQNAGRIVRMEGYFLNFHWEGEDFHAVAQEADSCCGTGGMLGFDIDLNGFRPFPDNTWVEVTGEIESREGIIFVRTMELYEVTREDAA